jgi:hypothetical protein
MIKPLTSANVKEEIQKKIIHYLILRVMKKFMVIPVFLIFGLCVIVNAQSQAPRADVRQGAQRARIHDGRTDGDVTSREAATLNAQQRHIRRSERRAKADGEVTVQEKARIERKQDRANRNIRRAKHNSVQQ